MNKRTLIGIGILIVGVILFVAASRATYVDPFTGIRMPSVSIPLLIIGLVAMIAGGWITWAGIHKARETEIKQLDIIAVTTDTIAGKKIVKTLGAVQARNNPLLGVGVAEIDSRRNLMKEARKLGANAITGMKTERQQTKSGITYYMYGTAVIVEDEEGGVSDAKSGKQAENLNYCPNCGARLSGDSVHCTQCGRKIRS